MDIEKELISLFENQIYKAKQRKFTNTEAMYQAIIRLVKNKNKEIQKQQSELEKKDKIINLMADNILKSRADTILPTDTEEIKQFFERKVK